MRQLPHFPTSPLPHFPTSPLPHFPTSPLPFLILHFPMKLTAMSFNIRYDKPDTDERNWRVRREAVAALIAHYSP
ncbi:MAG: hypothetical protein ACKO2T_15515, partial [Microcystis aeruginosa]